MTAGRPWGSTTVAGLVGVAAFASYSYSTDAAVATTQARALSEQSTIQEEFLSAINRSSIREYLHAYSSSPHVCGTPQDYETAVYTAAQLESFGIDAEIKEYYTLLSSPGDQSLSIVDPPASRRELSLIEGTVANDTCTTSEDLWPGSFITYAASGNVTASVVYANYGRESDFDWLEAQNVSLAGKIALVRYGGNFRGLKVMNAENRGMAAVIIYSDPNDDGVVKGAVYPEGTWRPEDSFQRGSAQYLSVASGDPLTPGWPSNKDAEYLDIADATSIPHIPVLALSSGQAKYILASLGGTKAPTAWQGGVALDGGYYAGNDDATVLNLFLDINNSVGPIWDVIGTLEGSEEPEKQVIIGNHRDAWTCGAVDPNSGSSVLLEIARILGGFARETGWRPRRTIKFASWDGEEFGLLGSTEYAEDHADELREGAIAYINVDAFLGHLVMASGSPAIAGLLSDAAKQVPANKFFGTETEVTLHDQWVVQQDALHTSLPNYDDGSLEPERLVTLLGSGSDYTAYYQHLGIVSANLLFMNSYSVYGTYHSSMDSIMFSETIGDPDYTTHETLARWWGLVALRLAEDEVLPLNYSTYALVMSEKLDDLETQVVDTLQRDVNFTGLYASIARFSDATSEFDANITAYTQSDNKTAEQTLRLNDKLVQLERYLLIDEGLPHRPWYKHVVFGPGYFEGYSGTAFPGIADNIAFADNATTIQAHVDEVSRVVDAAVAFLLEA